MHRIPNTDHATPSVHAPVHVIQPISEHTNTAILLHGRGSTGQEFAEDLCTCRLSDQTTLVEKLPGWRFVFPSSRELWSSAFQEQTPAWFEAHSLTDITARQDLQYEGIGESVSYLGAILDDEIDRLGGKAERVALVGISQGGAVGLWTLLCRVAPARLGAFIAASTWLPFATIIQNVFSRRGASVRESKAEREGSKANLFVESMMDALWHSQLQLPASFLSTPVFLGHGSDDAYVDVELGRQARDVLTQIGLKVQWKEYVGAEQEGHWLKVPEELDDIATALTGIMPS